MADAAFDRLDINCRWHYLMMIQFCSRGKRYNGVMPLAEAEMCSTASGKPTILAKLMSAGLVEAIDDDMVKVVRIDDHVPPPSVREASAATAVRVARHRKHKNGDHSECLPDGKCPHVSNEAGNERSNALHQDGDSDRQGRAVTGKNSGLDLDDEETWAEVLADEDRRAAEDTGGTRHWKNLPNDAA